MALTREEILNRKVGQDEVQLPGGGTVVVKGLSHGEVIRHQKLEDQNERTCAMVAAALVSPHMTYEDVLAWSEKGAAGDITTISEKVQELSRLTEGAGKSRVSRSGKRS